MLSLVRYAGPPRQIVAERLVGKWQLAARARIRHCRQLWNLAALDTYDPLANTSSAHSRRNTMPNYAISHWPDTDELIAKAKRLVAEPARPIRRDKMQTYLIYFETRCAGSKVATDRARR